jgi:uncharacterized membrane protein YdbT with pleckstrin-like domain
MKPDTSAPTLQPKQTDIIAQKSQTSRATYPELNLSQTEYVICSVRRHPIGLILPCIAAVILLSIALSVLFNYDAIVTSFSLTGALASVSIIVLPVLLFCALILLGTYITYFVYTRNRLFVTNERVIQEIQRGLFSQVQQSINLSNIDDVGFDQNGLFQTMFNYGLIRITTRGDDAAYRFTFAARPKDYIAALNNAIDAFKTGQSMDEILD